MIRRSVFIHSDILNQQDGYINHWGIINIENNKYNKKQVGFQLGDVSIIILTIKIVNKYYAVWQPMTKIMGCFGEKISFFIASLFESRMIGFHGFVTSTPLSNLRLPIVIINY